MPQWWPWRLRETLLMILGFAVVLAMWNTAEKMPTGLTWPQTWDSLQTPVAAVAADNYTRQIDTYLEGRRKGLTQEQIAKDIFKVSKACPNRLVPRLLEYRVYLQTAAGYDFKIHAA